MKIDKNYVHKVDKQSINELKEKNQTKGLYIIEKKRIKDKLLLINSCQYHKLSGSKF